MRQFPLSECHFNLPDLLISMKQRNNVVTVNFGLNWFDRSVRCEFRFRRAKILSAPGNLVYQFHVTMNMSLWLPKCAMCE